MNKHIAVFAIAMLFGFQAFAIDSARCPDELGLTVAVEKVYRSSKYKNIPGWKEAQATLKSVSSMEVDFKLDSRTNVCVYKDNAGNKATLSTAAFQDPEERNPSLVDQLVLNLNIEKSTYVAFVPVKSYDQNGIVLHDSPYSVKVKARLYIAATSRLANLDLGKIGVSIR